MKPYIQTCNKIKVIVDVEYSKEAVSENKIYLFDKFRFYKEHCYLYRLMHFTVTLVELGHTIRPLKSWGKPLQINGRILKISTKSFFDFLARKRAFQMFGETV